MHNKTECVIHMNNLKQPLDHGLVLKKVHKMIKFNENPEVKPNIDKKKNIKRFWKRFFKLRNNVAFEKNDGKRKKTWIYESCHNRKKKKLFSIRAKLSL